MESPVKSSPFDTKNDPIKRLTQMKEKAIEKKEQILQSSSNMNSSLKRQLPSGDSLDDKPIKQLTAWKGQFNDKLHQVQEEILLHITQKPIAVEEMSLLIRNTISELKLSLSDLLNTMSDLIKRFVKKSKKGMQQSNTYWTNVVFDLNSQLEHIARVSTIEEDKRKGLENENKKLRNEIAHLKKELIVAQQETKELKEVNWKMKTEMKEKEKEKEKKKAFK